MNFAQVNSDAGPAATTADDIAGLVRAVLAELLGTRPESVALDRPLREIGLDSAQLMKLVVILSQTLGRPVPSWVVWQYPTVAALAAHLAGDTSSAAAHHAPARPGTAQAAEPVAIIGLGCRLPGGVETPDALWQGLLNGLDAVREVPRDRWNAQEWLDPDPRATGMMNTRWGGFLDNVADFDAGLFSISPAEARQMDPQQRMALESTWAAVEDARIVHGDLAGSRTGVFLGTMAQEYHLATGADPAAIGTHSAVGWDNSIIAARIAYTLGLHGPALAVATACSSSLTATHLAVQSLRSGESDLALAGGVNVLLHPNTTVAMTKFGGMNPDGQCRAFDADAAGYVRGEGCGIIVLRRLSDALAAGDRIYAVIRGSAVNNDGASNGLTAPNPQAQIEVLRRAWQNAGIDPRDVAYVEAHGTGTPLGDPIEAGALGSVFAEGRQEALRIGSAKTNFGHLEPAAGVLGLMKTALALHHGELPASLHFDTPSPHIDFEANRLEVVAARQGWPGDKRRYAGVSGFGFGGTNAHVALEEAPYRRRLLVPLAADSEEELRETAATLAERARTGRAWYAPELLAAGTGEQRVVAAVTDHHGLADALQARIDAHTPRPSGAARPELAFLFSGHGGQWLGMGRDLLAEPAFRAALEECDRAVRAVAGWSVTEELLADADSSRLDATDVIQPLLFSLQVAYARTLQAWGLEPTVVVGQSVGEVAGAVAAGALSLDEGARVITLWSQLCAERASEHGTLLVAELPLDEAERLAAETGGEVSVAGHLSPGQVCLSAPAAAVDSLERTLAERDIPTQRVNIDYPAHSPQIASLGPELARRLGTVRTRPAAVPMWSTVTDGFVDGTSLDAAYWVRNMCEPFQVVEAVTELTRERDLRIVEIAPHPVLKYSVRRTLMAHHDDRSTVLGTGHRGRPARQALEDVAARLWCDGFDLDWGAVTGRPQRSASTAPVVLTVSGKTAAARGHNAARLAEYLRGASAAKLRDVAYTAANHRSHLEQRAVAVAASADEAVDGLRAVAGGVPHAGVVEGVASAGGELAVLFTGQGSQRIGMGRELYQSFPVFRQVFDEVCGALEPHLRMPLAAVVFADPDGVDAPLVHQTEFAQPALFAFEVALFRLWQSFGVEPEAVAGHSVGELVAAHVAGVLSLADAARLVAARGRLMQGCEPGGVMVSLEASEAEVVEVLEGAGGRVSIGGLNGPAQTVVSGDEAAVAVLVEHFTGLGRRTRRLEVSHAFHSAHMDSMLTDYAAVAASCSFAAPRMSLVSSVDGSVMGSGLAAGEGVRDPRYWVRQVREAVRFLDVVRTLESSGIGRFLECGPAPVLSAMAAGCVTGEGAVFVASQSQRGGEQADESRDMFRAVGILHTHGQSLDFTRILPPGNTTAPVDLPTYAFQRERYWIDGADRPSRHHSSTDDALWQAIGSGEAQRLGELLGVTDDNAAVTTLLPYLATWRERQDQAADIADWMYEESWQPLTAPPAAPAVDGHWLLVGPTAASGLAETLADALTEAGASAHILSAACDRTGYATLLADLSSALGDKTLSGVLALTPVDETPHPEHPATTTGIAQTLALVQALGDASVRAPLWLITRGAVRAHDKDPAPRPNQTGAWGLGHVVALEHANRWGGLIDLPAGTDADPADPVAAAALAAAAQQLPAVLAAQADGEEHLALRSTGRYVRRLHRAAPSTVTRPWSPRGTVLITGGSGALAGHLARSLADRGAEHLVLVSRRGRDAEGAEELIHSLETAGARVTLASCDVTDRRQLSDLLVDIASDEAPLRAVFHTAGLLDDRFVDRLDTKALAAAAAPKLGAARLLAELTRDHELDAFVLYSSVIGTLGNIGQANYATANAALDALAHQLSSEGIPAVSIGWGPWADGGMTHGAAETQLRRTGLTPMAVDRALSALDAALATKRSAVIAQIDWDRCATSYTQGRNRPFLDEITQARALTQQTADSPAGDTNPLRRTLLEVAEPDREAHLRRLLAAEAAAVLGIEDPLSLDPERGFKDLGFNSMMAVDFAERVQRRTGVTTPRTLVFDSPDLSSAARWLLAELAPTPPVALPAPAGTRGGHRGDEPLAVVGVGLRMPGDAHDLDSLWQVLAEGRDTVSTVPADRFDIDAYYDPDPDAEGSTYARHASFLGDVASFDASFFGISPREAEPMDPQHRLLLEAAWHSLEDAGIRPRELRDSRTGVFVGAGAGEYGKYRHSGAPDTYTLTGALSSFNAGRLSYHLGLQGPALSIDTACSSSLVALHLACEALRNDECELALAGGVQVLADPGMFVALSRSHALSPDGRSKAFSADADGYGRGEGVGVIAVMRLSDAIEQDRNILGVIRATAVNHDGASSGITAPNGTSQQKVIRAALDSAGLSAADVDYVECHGTGTSLGDPIEVQALDAVYGKGREPGRELGLGTAKSVIGHLESAAGIAGVCKMLASFKNDALPATMHSSPRNPNIAWDRMSVRVVDEFTPWVREEGRPRRAGVSSFGLSGTNAHVVLEEPPVRDGGEAAEAVAEGPYPVVVSGRDVGALREQAGRWASWLEGHAGVPLAGVAVTAARHRTHFEQRACVAAGSVAGLVDGLRAVAEGVPRAGVVEGVAGRRGRVVFVYPGQGSQWVGMGRELLAGGGVFASVVDECDAALRPFTGWSVRDVLAGVEGGHPPFDRVDVVQPALFAMGVALSAVWRSLGVEPAAVVGHSQGEVVAAVVSGALSLEQGARVVALRSRAVLSCAGQGGMALVGRPLLEVEGFLAPYGDALSVAAVNTAGSTVVSGRGVELAALVGELQGSGVFARLINVDYASHNAQMDPLLPGLAEGFAGLVPGETDIAFYSTVSGRLAGGRELDGGYWCRNLREPVRFDRALEGLLDDGHTVFVEISAHPVLSMPLTDAGADRGGVVVGSLARDRGGMEQLLHNAGLLHTHGHELDWDRILPATAGTGLVPLPTYAFQREHHWMETRKTSNDAGSLGLDSSQHPWLGAATPLADSDSHLLTGRLSLADHPWLKDHVLFDQVLVPGTGLLELAVAAANEVGSAGVAELTLAEPLIIQDAVRIQITVQAAENGRRPITIHSRPESSHTSPASSHAWTRHASGELMEAATDPAVVTAADTAAFGELARWPVEGAQRVELDGLYDRFGAQGIDYGPAFRGLSELWRKGDSAYGVVRLPEPGTEAGFTLHPALLDTALHVMKGVTAPGDEPEGALLPFEWSDVQLYAIGGGELRIRIDVEPTGTGQVIRAWAVDATGAPVVRIGQLHLRRATVAQLRAARTLGTDNLYRLGFQPLAATAPAGAAAEIVLGGTGHLATALGAEHLIGTDALSARLDAHPAAPARIVVDVTGWPPVHSAPEAAYRATEHALSVLQDLLSDERLESTELVWITRGSVSAADGDRVDGLAYAPLWGLLRCARSEHPERTLRTVDLGPDDSDRALLASAVAVTGEPELAVRDGQVLVARLVRAEEPAKDTTVRPLDPRGTVLITGGTGELGREVALRLVRRHQVRHLVLTSRRGADAPGAEDLVRRLTDEGAESVRVVACDAGRRDDLAQVLTLAGEDRPWTAVLHLAGILDDGLVVTQDAARLSRVMEPKVRGACYLGELTAGLDLAALVLFSSAAGTVGTAGQGIYAAANSYLDAFAARLRTEDRPVTSLAWGLWHQAGVGMTSHLGRADLDRMRGQGIAPLSFEQGLGLLDTVLGRPADNFVPVQLDLRAAQREADQGNAAPALLRSLVRARLRKAGSGTAPDRQGLREQLIAAPEDRRPEMATDLVLREVAGVLGLAGAGSLAPNEVLKGLGLDSLMAVELRRRLSAATGLSLPATLAFDHPTPEHIARLILARMDLPVPEAAGERKAPGPELTEEAAGEEKSVDELSAELDMFLAEAGIDLG